MSSPARHIPRHYPPPAIWCELYSGSRKGRFPFNGHPWGVTVQGKSIEGWNGINSSPLVAGGWQKYLWRRLQRGNGIPEKYSPGLDGVLMHRGVDVVLIRMSVYDKYSGSMKMTSHLDHVSRVKAASGANWSNRCTYRVFSINTHRD